MAKHVGDVSSNLKHHKFKLSRIKFVVKNCFYPQHIRYACGADTQSAFWWKNDILCSRFFLGKHVIFIK